MNAILFSLVSAILVASAAGVLFIKNTVHAAFALVGTFGCVAVLYLMLNADFVAMAQLLVYAGAILIMLLFALMLTQKKETVYLDGANDNRRFLAGLISTLFFVAFVRLVATSPWGHGDPSQTVLEGVVDPVGGTAMVVGKEFFSTFLLPFEVASVLLLMALIGAIVLALRDPDPVEQDAVVPKAKEPTAV
ncbi:MAG: NADH-quinone oxidoreductase subunit J [Cyanobacteria bacterium REEB65]|nr:NADH-quinone oxidoreductase subunit J [Cyanobacteria bacterium REEB65]